MKLKSVSGYVCYVKDIKKTAKFYKDLGFKIETNEPDRLIRKIKMIYPNSREKTISKIKAQGFSYT
jgi:predicted lactoylglutathione lyase